MDQHEWDEAYASTELVWTAEANRFVVGELADLGPAQAVEHGRGGLVIDPHRASFWLPRIIPTGVLTEGAVGRAVTGVAPGPR